MKNDFFNRGNSQMNDYIVSVKQHISVNDTDIRLKVVKAFNEYQAYTDFIFSTSWVDKDIKLNLTDVEIKKVFLFFEKLYMVSINQSFIDELKNSNLLPRCFIRSKIIASSSETEAFIIFNDLYNQNNLKIENVTITEV